MKKDDLITNVKTSIATRPKKKTPQTQTVKNLTAKHYKLLDLFYSGITATQAAIDVGFAVSSAHNVAHRVIESDLGKEYLKELSLKHQQKTFFTIEKIENELMSLYDEMVQDDEKNFKERMSLLKLMMDYKGMFINHGNTTSTNIQINLIEHKPNIPYDADPRLNIKIENDTEDII